MVRFSLLVVVAQQMGWDDKRDADLCYDGRRGRYLYGTVLVLEYKLGDKIHRHLGGSIHLHITRDKMSTTTPQKSSCHGEWTTPVRVRVLERLSLGYNKSEVSRQTGVSRQTIQEWAKRPSSRRSGKQCSGRPHSLTPSNIRHIIYVLQRNWEGRRLCWRRLGQESGCNVSGRTIQRALAAEGYTR